MQILLAVVEDLYTFAVSVLFPHRLSGRAERESLSLPSSRVVSSVRELEIEPRHSTVPAVVSVVGDEVLHAEAQVVPILPQKHTIVYCAQPQIPLRTTPDGSADTAIATVFYGDLVMVLEAETTWSYVAVGNKKGYVPTAALVQKAAEVYPTFRIGEENASHGDNTVRVRLVIRDEFATRLSQLPLQAHEYVYYKLLRRGTHISWPDIRPRTPGSWARILGMLDTVTVGDTPALGAVMEFCLDESKAHLAYVEKVFPDGTIQISEVDWPDRGIYNERVLVEDEWRALNPTFIAIG